MLQRGGDQAVSAPLRFTDQWRSCHGRYRARAMAIAVVPWWVPLLLATRRNLVPGLVLQAIALALVGAYYLLPATCETFTAVAHAKQAGGYWFSATAGIIAGGLIPWLVQVARGQLERRLMRLDLLFIVAVWAWRGAEVDAFYRFQEVLFGGGHDVVTLVCKVLVDQLLYSPLWACPLLVLAYRYREAGFSASRVREAFTWSGYLREILTVQASAWTVWVPAVTIVYSLPSALQFPLFAVVVCFWSLLLTTLTTKR